MSQDMQQDSKFPMGQRVKGRHIALAAVLILLLAGVVILRGAISAGPDNLSAEGAPALMTRVGEVRQIALADASQLILDTDTRIVTAFTRNQRKIEVQRGRVRVVVGKDKTRPFIIQAAGRDIVTRGMMMGVSVRHGLEVYMLQGGADIRGGHGIALRTGEKLTLTDGVEAKPEVTAIGPEYGQWVDEIQGFKDAPVRDVIAQANIYGMDKIELADPAMGEEKISGQINIRNPASVASVIAQHLGLRVDRSKPGRILLAPSAEKSR